MNPHRPRRQVLLFFVAVILPTIVLVALSLRMIRQENELAESRRVERRQRLADDLGQQFLVRLERIKLEAVREQSLKKDASPLFSENPLVATVAWVEANHLTFPWEILDGGRLDDGTEDYVRNIRQGENAEFVLKRMNEAARFYEQALNLASDPVPLAAARLSLARTLIKSGSIEAGRDQYESLLELPYEVRHEYEVPYSFYAAGQLIGMGEATEKLLSALQTAITGPSRLSPTAAHMIGSLADSIAVSSFDDSLIQQVQEFREAALQYVRETELLVALQGDFSNLTLIAQRGIGPDSNTPVWIPYGDGPWMVGIDSSLGGEPPLAIVVRGDQVWAALAAEDSRLNNSSLEPRLVDGRSTEGTVLGSSFVDLKIDFSSQPDAEPAPRSLQYSFYLVVLVLVLSITLFGAYLLWRDMQRELNMAATRSQFVASVSHELKTPLTAIRMFAETLRMGRSTDLEEQAEFLGTIVDESERLSRLLNNVLDFSKIEKGTKRYNPEPTELGGVVEAAARAMRYPLSQEGFELSVEMTDDLPEVAVDRDAVEQAILNLLANALKYSGDSRQIDLHLLRQNGEAQIRVTDRGIGIDPAEQSRIFEKFYRADTTENESLSGTGLGLALVDHIAKAHGGRVEIESELGKGSTFSIHLPLETTT